jgi:hypothetical protein
VRLNPTRTTNLIKSVPYDPAVRYYRPQHYRLYHEWPRSLRGKPSLRPITYAGLCPCFSGWRDKLAARKKPYSLELVGTNDDGIRYILMLPGSEMETVQRNLLSFLPGLKVRQVEDYASAIPEDMTQVVELRLVGDFILPLKSHKALEEHDPFAYLTGHMTKLAPDELIAFQIVTVPVYGITHHRVTRRQRTMEARIALGKDVSSKLELSASRLAICGGSCGIHHCGISS